MPERVANPIVGEGLVLIVLRGKGQAEGYESRRRDLQMCWNLRSNNSESLLMSTKHGLPMGHS